MTIDDVKKELRAYINDCRLIESIEDQISFYTSKLDSCTAEISAMPKGTPLVQDRIAEYIAKIEELKTEKYSRLKEIENKRDCIERTILALEQPYKTMLHLTYISDNKLKITARKMGYEYKYACKIHGKALVEYKKLRESTENFKKDDKSS